MGYITREAHQFLVLAFPKASLNNVAPEAGFGSVSDFGRLHDQVFFDPFIRSLVLRITEESKQDNPLGPLFIDQAVQTLIVSLLQQAGRSVRIRPKHHRLSEAELVRTIDEIEDRLSDKIMLSALADRVGLTEIQFCRAFKGATGQSPYQFVLERRVQRARRLLEEGRLTIADIAYTCGFSSQQHMTNIFTRRVGISPGKYRAAFRG